MRHTARPGWLLAALLALPALPAVASADASDDPLRILPPEADLFFKVEQPRRLVESITGLDAYRHLEQLPGLREYLDSTTVRRFYQLVAYYERDLGAPWPELLDKLAGGGLVLGLKIGGDNPPALFIVQGQDAALLQRFVELAGGVLEQEAARADAKTRIERGMHRSIPTLGLGPDFRLALVANRLLVANKTEVLHKAIDRALELKQGGTLSSVVDLPVVQNARKVLPADPLVWGWVHLEPHKQSQQAKELFARPRNDIVQTLLIGGWLDVAGRSPFIAGGLYRTPEGLTLSVRLPAGRDGMQPELAAVTAGEPGSLPLLEPPGVVFSDSFYYDFHALYAKRTALMPPKPAKDFEEGQKQVSRFLPGASLEKLLLQAGPHHRLVAAHQEGSVYQTRPRQRFPAFAHVVSMRDPAFARSAEALLRAGAFAASVEVGLKMVEETVGDVRVVSYRFPEDRPFPNNGDPDNVRFNFSPSFAAVGDQFLAASTVEFCKVLIGELRKPGAEKPQPQPMRLRLYGAGGAAVLGGSPEQLLTQTILTQGATMEEAREQVKAFVAYLEKLGRLQVSSDYAADQFRFEIAWKYGK